MTGNSFEREKQTLIEQGYDFVDDMHVPANPLRLDFSVTKKGHLTAYRWSGEALLSAGNPVSVAAWPVRSKRPAR